METSGPARHPDKTGLIEFGWYAAERRVRQGQGKAESFNFLGFTHYCGRTQERKGFIVKRKRRAKRFRAELREVKATRQRRRHDPVAQ